MAKDIRYGIKRDGRWLQRIEPNKNYASSACAPTMGARHTFSEYKTIWGETETLFERLTASNYIKILFEEYRWEDRKPLDIKIIAKEIRFGGGFS